MERFAPPRGRALVRFAPATPRIARRCLEDVAVFMVRPGRSAGRAGEQMFGLRDQLACANLELWTWPYGQTMPEWTRTWSSRTRSVAAASVSPTAASTSAPWVCATATSTSVRPSRSTARSRRGMERRQAWQKTTRDSCRPPFELVRARRRLDYRNRRRALRLPEGAVALRRSRANTELLPQPRCGRALAR